MENRSKFAYTVTGYKEAVLWLKETNQYSKITKELSDDGYTIVSLANEIYNQSLLLEKDAHGDLEGMTKEEIIQDLNREYPEELIEQFKDRINVQQTKNRN